MGINKMVKVQSAKSKGRKFEDDICQDIQNKFNLTDEDIRRVPASVNGIDIQLISEKARKNFPFSVECKSQKTIKVKEWWKQAKTNVEDDTYPLLTFRVPNTSQKLVIIDWYDFLNIYSNIYIPKTKHLNTSNDINIILNKINELRQELIRSEYLNS